MLVVRALLWLFLMSQVVPFEEFDLTTGTFKVDYKALGRQAHALAHPCKTEPALCEAARDLLQQAQTRLAGLAGMAQARAEEGL